MRNTLKDSLKLSGVGIHSGEKVNLYLHPARYKTGIVFRRGNVDIAAIPNNVVSANLSIVLSNDGVKVATVEHLLAVLYMMDIFDVIIEVDGIEVPILDGSGKVFLEAIEDVGVEMVGDDMEFTVDEPIWVRNNDRYVVVLPSEEKNFSLSYTIMYPHPDLRCQHIFFEDISYDIFRKEIAPARTFGFLKDVERLWKEGYARGGSLENAVVLTDDGYLNERRFKDECIRHKVLDFLGALGLIGHKVYGFFIANKSGHNIDVLLADAIKKKALAYWEVR